MSNKYINPHISIVSPVYGCKTCLYELYHRLTSVLEQINKEFEIILINDNSPDGAWETIKELSHKDNKVKGINLSRNFGQHYAIAAGLTVCKGEWVIVMDCDLQDKPEEILKLYSKTNEGYDVVLGRRKLRQDSIFKVACSRLFYQVLGYLTETTQDSAVANFGIYNWKVIKAINEMGDNMRYFPTMVKWVGFRQTTIDIEHAERTEGKSGYSIKKLLHLGLDVILAFSDKPLRLTVKLGLLISATSFIVVIISLIRHFLGYVHVLGWTSMILSLWLLAGIIIFLIGIVGLYIGKTFENVKKRPRFIISDEINLER